MNYFSLLQLSVPGLWMEARESIREREFGDAIEKSAAALRAMFETKIRYSIAPGARGEADVLAVVCPLVSEEMSDSEEILDEEIAAND